MSKVYAGFTYEIDATATATISTSHPNLDNITVDWSGDYQGISYINPIDTQKTYMELRFSKVMNVADSNKTYETSVNGLATDRTWSPQIYTAQDSGKCIWEIGTVYKHNNPNICIQDKGIASKVVEGDEGARTKISIEICLDEPAWGEALEVSWTTRDGTAIGGVGVRNLAYDEFGNPFISVTESKKDNYRIVYDGGFPKYYDGSAVANSIQFLKNAVAYLHHNANRPKRILAIGDPHPNYDITREGGSNFRRTFTSVASTLGYEIDVCHIGDFHGGAPTGSHFDRYAMCFYMGTSNGNLIPAAGVNGFEQAIKSGMGIMLITDHNVFQGSVNAIAAKFGANFYGDINRHPVSIDDLKRLYGDHVLWSNMTGMLPAGGSEGNIGNVSKSDYLHADGVLRFEIGERCKNIEVEILGDTLPEGLEYFYVDLFNPSHGKITCGTSTIYIDDDDIIPCGQSASAGGDGVAYFKLSSGSEPKVLATSWIAYGRHDRFDIYRAGVWDSGSQQDLDGLSGANARPTYDRSRYNQLTNNVDGTAILELRQNKCNRAGCGTIFTVVQPLLTNDPFYVDLRVEGPVGTGWNMEMHCIEPRRLTRGQVDFNNSKYQMIDQRELFDCDGELNGGEQATYRLTLKNEATDIFGTANNTGISWYDFNAQRFGFKALPCKVKLHRAKQLISETAWIPAGQTATLDWSHTKGTDFRYLEMSLEYDVSKAGSDYYKITTDGTNQSKPLRVAWTANVRKV